MDSNLDETPEPTIEEDGLNWLRKASRRISVMSRVILAASRQSMVSRLDDERRFSLQAGVSSLMEAMKKASQDSIVESIVSNAILAVVTVCSN